MLNRFIKTITNKPTEIKGPLFLKSFNKENEQIKELEELLNICNEECKKFIEQDIKKLKYGQIGENNVYYELKNSFTPMVCMHDLRLNYRGSIAQIDFLVLTSKYIYVIECKNLIGDISITQDGEFIRYIKDYNGKTLSKQGMYSPIVQNERHINIIKEILSNELKYKNKLKRIESLIVAANPRTIINKKYAPKHICENIIRYDQLIDKIKSHQNNKKIDWIFIENDMREIANCLLKFNKKEKIDYERKYGISLEKNDTKEEKVKKWSEHSNLDIVSKCEDTISKSDEELRQSLKLYRLETSKTEGLQPYMVFNNDTMEELITKRPKSIFELRNVKGFGPIKCEKYGNDLINIITEN